MEETRVASLSSSPSRHSSSLPRPIGRQISTFFARAFRHKETAHGSEESDDAVTPETDLSIGESDSTMDSRHLSPWTSTSVTPLSTPGTSIAHGDLRSDPPCASRPNEKKRFSWFGSTPASQWTSHRAPVSGDGPSPPPTRVLRSKPPLHPRSSSWSSSSGSSAIRCSLEHVSKTASSSGAIEQAPQQGISALVPNAQFLGLMLLVILLISSPLIKVFSVLLFIVVVSLDDS